MNGQGKLLTHFLKNADKLVIPVYQRNYDWKEEHCKNSTLTLLKLSGRGNAGTFSVALFLSAILWAAAQTT